MEEVEVETMTGADVAKTFARMKKKLGLQDNLLRLSCHPNSSITIEQIRSTTLAWSLQGWTPDLVVIDYADILAPCNGHAETRDQINETWKRMRRLSQELHCCVVTATQADAASYSADNLDMTNFSEDKRKFAHVTAMVGINQNGEEKTKQIQRLNYLVLRDSEFTSEKQVVIANALKIAHPTVCSSF
jgi:replicative DNA helicase